MEADDMLVAWAVDDEIDDKIEDVCYCEMSIHLIALAG
jgi:hypothetical protein